MASPLINWDDFENQALLVQELLSDSKEIAGCHFMSEMGVQRDTSQLQRLGDSPVLITKVSMPQSLLLLSPEAHLDSIEKREALPVTPVNRGSAKSGLQRRESEAKTPLKDCTNINQDLNILTDNMVTPEKFKSLEKSQSTLCPSSAEFRKFLDDIMTVSPVVNEDCFENAEVATVNQCQLQENTHTPKSLPVVKKVHARRGTYDLDVPSCDLSRLCESEGKSALEDDEQPTAGLLVDLSTDTCRNACFVAGGIANEHSIVSSNVVHRLEVSDKCEADTSDQIIPRQIDNTEVQNSNTGVQNSNTEVQNSNTGVQTGERQNDFTEMQKGNSEALSIEVQQDNNEAQKDITEVKKDITEVQKDITEVQKDNETYKDLTEVHKDETEVQKTLLTVTDSDLNAPEPSRKLLFKNSSFGKPQSRFSSAKSVGMFIKSQAPLLEAADTEHSCLHGRSAGDIAEEPVTSEITTVENGKIVLEKHSEVQEKREGNFVDASENSVESSDAEQRELKYVTSSSDDSCAEKQNIPVPKLPSKTAASLSGLPAKTTEKTDTCPSTVVLKKAPVSKLPLMRPGQMQSKLRRPSGLASSQSQRASSASAQGEGIQRSNAVMLLKPVAKQHIDSSNLGQRKTQETSRLLPKLSLRPPGKVSEQCLVSSKVSLGQPKLEVKVCEQEAVTSLQPQKMQSVLHLEAAKPISTRIMCRSSAMKGIPMFKEPVKKPVKTGQQMDGSRTVTKRTSPVTAVFPLDGSRTITKDVRPDMSRTVTKADQPAGSRTVTKTSDVLLSKTPKNRQSTPGTSDRFIAPRRLSSAFNKTSSLSKNSVSVNHSFQKPALDSSSSSFESVVTKDESGAFKVE